MRGTRFHAALAMALALPSILQAGFCCSDTGSEPRHDFQFLAGYSPASTASIHGALDRRFVLAGFSYSYTCWAWPSISVNLTGTLLPGAIVIQPTETFLDSPSSLSVPGHAVYGFAVAPLGLTADSGRKHRVHQFLETMEGIIASTEPIPV